MNTIQDEMRLKEQRGIAQRRFDEIERLILRGDNSLVQLLVRAHRAGHDPAKARTALHALQSTVEEAREIYEAAIAQPEPKITQRERVVL